VSHYLSLKMGFRRIITFKDKFSAEGQVTGYILKAADRRRQKEVEDGDRSMVNKLKIVQ